MDLDQDGKLDVLTGAYQPGHFHFFRQIERGQFAAAQSLNHADGKPIEIESAAVPHAFDWNGDGRLDLVAGFIQGPLFLMLQEDNLKFGKPQELRGGDTVISGSDLGPIVADWDQDGTPDLLVGEDSGTVTYYRGTRRNGQMQLDSGQVLVRSAGWTSRSGPGVRFKPHVTDWNLDGKPDLLVGDFASRPGPEPKLTAAQIRQRDRLRKEQATLQKRRSQTNARIIENLRKKFPGQMTAAQQEEYGREFTKQMNEAFPAKDQKRSAEIFRALQPLEAQPLLKGHVWVYLRK